MAETALALASCDPNAVTGLCVYSTTYLNEIGREIRTLDGKNPLGDWKPTVAYVNNLAEIVPGMFEIALG